MTELDVDLDALTHVALDFDRLRAQFDQFNRWGRADVECLGHSAVTSAFAHLGRNWDEKRDQISGQLEESATAARDAMRAYRDTESRLRSEYRDSGGH